MEPLVECLRCGHLRQHRPGPLRHQEAGDCPRCGYLGWAFPLDLDEEERRGLRDRPPERRRLRVVAA